MRKSNIDAWTAISVDAICKQLYEAPCLSRVLLDLRGSRMKNEIWVGFNVPDPKLN